MKHVKSFEKFNIIKENVNSLPVGTKVHQAMGAGGTATVIPWFNWRNATDGTYSEPNQDNYVAVKWDDGRIGFAPIAYLSIVKPDGSKEHLGRLISDEEYDTTGDEFEIIMTPNSDNGTIEFEDGTVDNFITYDDGRIAFDNWYPEEKYNSLVKAIKEKNREIN